MKYVAAELYGQIEQSIPLACVDFVPVRETDTGREFGLIKRASPFGEVWCHLGGRIGRGESIREALLRHADETLAVGLMLGDDPQPDWVYQWFPPEERPPASAKLVHGTDPRKHAIALSFVVPLLGEPMPANEALAFRWFEHGRRPEPLWPGCAALLDRLKV